MMRSAHGSGDAGRAAKRRRRRALIGGAALGTALLLGGGTLAAQILDRPGTPDATVPVTRADSGTESPDNGAPSESPEAERPIFVEGPDFGPLGPDGFLELRLGMTVKEATDTRRLRVGDTLGACTEVYLAMYGDGLGGPHGYVTRRRGLSLIFGQGTMTTPEDITHGSTRTRVEVAYPKVTARDGYLLADASADTQYFFAFEDKRVTSWGLTLRDNPCLIR